MEIIDRGYTYSLESYDGEQDNHLTFMKRYRENYPSNLNSYPGTNCQEVLRALIDRVKYLDQQKPSEHNNDVIAHLRAALTCFELRAAEIHGRDIVVPIAIETLPTCRTCGHIQCDSNHYIKSGGAI